jgi:hypothetical protein
MSNNLLGLNGAQPQKQTRFSPIYTGRWSSGLWTNRSPLRDANTNRLTEKFYGPAGDALIGGQNCEITTRLTLARRPGNPVFDSNSYTTVDRFESFRMFGPTSEQINVMVDQANALYSLYSGTKSLVWTKSTGAGQSYMQSVGNSLYFANGVDNKKWLQTLTTWQALKDWTGATTPILDTFFIDPNGNIQQLTTAGVSASGAPTWSTTVPSSGNNFQGGTTTDGTAVWTNRGNPVKNWGIKAPTKVLSPIIGSSRAAWAANTFYSKAGVIIDSNGNLQQVSTAGKSGALAPTWATVVGNTTTDGTAVWTVVQLAASLTWAAHTAYAPGKFLVANAGGTNCLFQLAPYTQPTISGNVTAAIYNSPHTGAVGAVTQTFPAGAALNTATGTSFLWNQGADVSSQPGKWETLNTSGEITGSTTPFSQTTDYMIAFTATLSIPVAGQYTFTIKHQDGMLFGIGGAATKVSGPSTDALGHTQTVVQGYTIMGANNAAGLNTDTVVVNFPAAGTYGIEVDYDFWYHSGNQFSVICNGSNVVSGTAASGTTQPIWPAWSTSYAPNYPSVSDGASGNLVWNNLGPTTDYVWAASTNFTLPNTTIVDPNSNQEAPYRTGVTGTSRPTFSTLLNQLTNDNPNLIWLNQGAASAPTPGTISTFSGGWSYSIALVNTLDDTVSNCTPLSATTGNFVGASGVTLAAGDGLPVAAQIDPQCDYVAIFRTTDGEATPFLIPGASTLYTLKLSTYLTNGYTDTTPDTGLNNLIEGAIAGENTPPDVGARNLTYHLNRIFFSIGNTVYWTSGPDSPVGNGTDGVGPLNFNEFPSLVQRIVPLVTGALVFTVSDVFLIQGQGTASSPIQKGVPYLEGVGILSYNALDICGSIIGLFTTDKQFILFDPSSGVDFAGHPIGDQFRKNNGQAGTSWNPANVYVTWHVDGEDQAWYVSDGQFGWYRLMPTPAPETGRTWSPFAKIIGGCKAVQSIEVSPGVHKLVLGPTGTGSLLNRDLTVFADNGTSYTPYAIVGSAVLAQPGQIGLVSFITTESVRLGTPLWLGVLMDEAYPYFTDPFESLTEWETDPPGLPPSQSFYGQRFYLSEMDEAAVCRHMQIQVNWATEAVQNELLSLTVFGAYAQEA